MKGKWWIGTLWLLLNFSVGVYGQNIANLDIRVLGPPLVASEAMLKKLHIPNPIQVEFSKLNPKIEQMIEFFEYLGYPFVRIHLYSINPCQTGISGKLLIDPGDIVYVDTLLNRTGYRISNPVLYRMLNIRPGDLYRESTFKEASLRLNQVLFLKQSRPMEIGFHQKKASVYLFPEKAGSSRFDGWVGLSPDLRSGGKLTFSGALSLNLSNILGQGENWQFSWNRNQDGSQKLNIGSHIPYLAGLPFGVQAKFDLFRQDTSYINLNWDAGIPYHFTPSHLLNLFIRHRESSMLVPLNGILNSNGKPFTSFLSGISWELNHLDNQVNPYQGFELRLEASTGKKSIPDSISMIQSEFTFNISWFQPLVKNLTCAFFLQSGYRKSPAILRNEKYRIGGSETLRGFDEDVFFTDAFAVTSIELRYLLDKTSHLIVLTDIGFLRNAENENFGWKAPVGVGLGGQIRTAGGLFRIIFALGRVDDQLFNFKNSKIHLGYIGVF
jgi:outer membrane protein assembly factor BamA